jgi:glycosyltransferase involved in cell wall biosynthesis
MKVLVITPRLPHSRAVSGHQIVYQRLLALNRLGHEVGLICFAADDDEAYLDEMRPLLVEIERVVAPPVWFSVAGPATRWLHYYTGARLFRRRFFPELQKRIGDVAERGRYDVVAAEFAYMGQHLHRNPYLSAVRRVVSVHRSPMLETLKMAGLVKDPVRRALLWWAHGSLRRFETELYRAADRVLVLSAEERYRMLTLARDLRVSVVPGGVDPDFFRASAESREEAVVTTGDYEDPANTDAVLWFAKTVWPRLRRDQDKLLFYVVGPHPPDALLGLPRRDPRIVVSGWVPDVRPYLAKAKVFVCPQRVGSGVRGKLLEAMAMNLPVVTTTLGGEGLAIQPGETGFLADTPELMAEYIRLLLHDVALRDAMGRRARQLVVERFSWKRSGELLERVLRELVHAA